MLNSLSSKVIKNPSDKIDFTNWYNNNRTQTVFLLRHFLGNILIWVDVPVNIHLISIVSSIQFHFYNLNILTINTFLSTIVSQHIIVNSYKMYLLRDRCRISSIRKCFNDSSSRFNFLNSPIRCVYRQHIRFIIQNRN